MTQGKGLDAFMEGRKGENKRETGLLQKVEHRFFIRCNPNGEGSGLRRRESNELLLKRRKRPPRGPR